MVLDEDSLEAMLRRQGGRDEAPPETVRTDETDEYEVYERKEDSHATLETTEAPPAPTAPAPTAPPPQAAQPTPQPPAEAAPTHEDFGEFEVFTREPEDDPDADATPFASPDPTAPEAVLPEAFREPTPEPASVPEPTPEPVAAPPSPPEPVFEEPTPEPEPVPRPTPEPTPAPEATEPPRRRPIVWPPIGNRQAEAPAAAAPEPEPERMPKAAPEPTPEPAPRTHAPTPHAFPDTQTDGSGCRIAVVQATFNQEITDDMAALAIRHAEKSGATVAHHVTVPGVYDLPLMVQHLLRQDDVDAAVVIGCVVQGETSHDELITHATAKSLQEVSLATEKPVGLGIIGPGMTWKQAEARISNGKHAVEAALAQWEALQTH